MVFFQVVLAALVASVAAQCPEAFFQSGNKCFTVVERQELNMTWDECQSECQAFSNTGVMVDLATFPTAEDLQTFAQTWMSVGSTFVPDPYMWIGVRKVDGVWMSLDDQEVSLQNNMWEEGHPHDMGQAVFLDDVTMSSTEGKNSYGRLYFHCSMGIYEHHQRCLCEVR